MVIHLHPALGMSDVPRKTTGGVITSRVLLMALLDALRD
jgi:hypothetical protein